MVKKMTKKQKELKKKNIIKICIVSFAIVVVCMVCFFISSTSGEKYSSNSSSAEVDEDNLLQIAIKEAGEVSDNERISPSSITMDEYLEFYERAGNTVVLFEKDSCEYCKIAIPILENIIYESNVDLKSIDLETLSDEEKNTLAASDSYFSEGISTPLLVLIGDGSIKDSIEGLVTKETYISFFQEYGFME